MVRLRDPDGEWESLLEASVPVNKPAPVPVTNAVKRREILAKSIVGEDVPAFDQAIDKELSSRSKHQSVDIIMPEEARKVPKEKIITSRFVFIDKNHAKRIAGEVKAAFDARARMVVHGF